jgi:exodeoxyribonuclease V beta subunit
LHVDLNKSETSRVLADTERLQEDLRLLYVAMTRARYACWLGLAPVKSGNTKACQLEKSAIGYLLDWQTEQAADTLHEHLKAMKGDCESLTIEELPEASDALYQPVLSEQLVGSPRIAKTTIADNWWIASYSALKHSESSISTDLINLTEEPENAGQDTQGDEIEEVIDQTGSRSSNEVTIYTLPKGAGPGVLVHSLLEQCGRDGFKASYVNQDNTRKLVNKLFNQAAWEGKTDLVATALEQWLSMPLLDDNKVSLADLEEGQYRVEMEFLIGAEKVNVLTVDQLVYDNCYAGQERPKLTPNTVHGLMKGFIDLVFVHNNQYYVADYKFNSLGSNDLAYIKPNLEAAMLHKRYDLQLVIYVLALHRLLKSRLGEAYDYDIYVGGGVYLFLRGSQSASGGRVVTKPSKVLIETLDDLFAGAISSGDNL